MPSIRKSFVYCTLVLPHGSFLSLQQLSLFLSNKIQYIRPILDAISFRKFRYALFVYVAK